MADIDPIEATIQQLLQERAELDATIAALQRRVGKPAADGAATVPLSSLSGSPLSAGQAPVYRGEFFNLSMTEAAKKYLRRVGRPQKTPEILAALRRAEYKMRSKTPRATLYTSLKRSKDFVKVAPDTWDVSERHPEAAKMKEQELRNRKARTGTRKRRNKAPKASKIEESVAEGLKAVA